MDIFYGAIPPTSSGGSFGLNSRVINNDTSDSEESDTATEPSSRRENSNIVDDVDKNLTEKRKEIPLFDKKLIKMKCNSQICC